MPLVIFVDDSTTALAAVKMVTKDMPLDTKEYIEATTALTEIRAGMTPDLIVTDLNMPVMDGFQFLEGVRSVSWTARTPVLMLTTETKEELKVKGREMGLTGWIVKPFNPRQLEQALKRGLRLH